MILDMSSPVDRAAGATFMERMSYPTDFHRVEAIAISHGIVAQYRADLRAALDRKPAGPDADPLDAAIWNMLYRNRWRDVRSACRALRKCRAGVLHSIARRERMLAEGEASRLCGEPQRRAA